MTIPSEPLKLRELDTDLLTLDDVELFEAGGFSVRGFKQFMARHANWSPAQVGALQIGEMKEVIAEIGQALEASAVPKANSAA